MKEIRDIIKEIKILEQNYFNKYHNHQVLKLYYSMLLSNYKDYLGRVYFTWDDDIPVYYKEELNNKEIKKKVSKLNKQLKTMIKNFIDYRNKLLSRYELPFDSKISNLRRFIEWMREEYLSEVSLDCPTEMLKWHFYIKDQNSPKLTELLIYNEINNIDYSKFSKRDLKKAFILLKTYIIELTNLAENIVNLIKTNFEIETTIASI